MRQWSVFSSLIFAIFLTGCGTWPLSRNKAFSFALIGDVPYNDEQFTNLFPNMIRELNDAKIKFVVHDGDIKAGSDPCSDLILETRRQQFNTFRHPLIYIYGDNEWTDCGRATNGFDPVERLEKLRQMFSSGNESLGERKIRLERQSTDPRYTKFRENVRWKMGNVQFTGLNVPGSINNYGRPEFAERNAANIAFLKQSFEIAKAANQRAVMIIIQANPLPERGSTNRVHAGFHDLINTLETETIAFGKPVVLVHGDSHYFRIDKPLYGTKSKRRIENFTRVETFGNPDVHWLCVSVDPHDPEVFVFHPQLVRSNFVNQNPAPKAAQ